MVSNPFKSSFLYLNQDPSHNHICLIATIHSIFLLLLLPNKPTMEAQHENTLVTSVCGFENTAKQLREVEVGRILKLKHLQLSIGSYHYDEALQISITRKQQAKAYQLQAQGQHIQHIGHIGLQIHQMIEDSRRSYEQDKNDLENITDIALQLGKFVNAETLKMTFSHRMKYEDIYEKLAETINTKLTNLKSIDIVLPELYSEDPSSLWINLLVLKPTVTYHNFP